jgi:excisionase family DNA binding protein
MSTFKAWNRPWTALSVWNTHLRRHLVTKLDSSSEDQRLVYEVPEAGAMLGLTRNASYDAAKRGDIPTIRFGKLLRVPKAAFHKMLQGTSEK